MVGDEGQDGPPERDRAVEPADVRSRRDEAPTAAAATEKAEDAGDVVDGILCW